MWDEITHLFLNLRLCNAFIKLFIVRIALLFSYFYNETTLNKSWDERNFIVELDEA